MTDNTTIKIKIKELVKLLNLSTKEVTYRAVKCYYDSLQELKKVSNADVVDMQANKIINNVVYVIGTILGKTEEEMYLDLIKTGVRKQPKRNNDE